MTSPPTGAEISSAPRPARNLTGALWMLASGVGFTVFLVLAKQLSTDINPGFLAFWRAFIALIVTLPIILLRDPAGMRSPQPRLLVLRSVFGSLGFVFSLFAISALPLSEFNAISFSRALFVTLLAAFVLREAVGPHRWGAVAIGFLGVLIMVMPQAVFFWLPESVSGTLPGRGTLYALVSALSLAGGIVLVKFLSATHTPLALLTWANLLSSCFLLPFVFFPSTVPSFADWGIIVAMALAGVAAQFCYISAMSVGDASFLSPMDYLRLPMAALADWLLFKLLPGTYVWFGATIIIAATLYITVRERAVARRGRDAP